MDGLLETILLEPNLLYLIMIAAAWVGVLALFVPGTGLIELLAAAGLLLGLGGILQGGGGIAGLVLLAVSFVVYALAILQQFSAASARKRDGWPVSPVWVAVLATAAQVGGGLLIAADLPELSWLMVVLLALGSFAIYRWMLLPTVTALRPPPQAGVEALIGHQAEVRTASEGPGKPAMVYLNGELWQAVSDDVLAVGDLVDVIDRQGMRLLVQKSVPPRQRPE